jgi:acetolactate synthase-1/2/3 large subunit
LLNGAQFTVEFLKKAGVRHAFGIPGHGNISIFDALKDSGIRTIPIKHEQWGGHMADGYFRANGRVPAVVTTSVGPGATNLTTAMATAFVDSSTMVALTGDIQTYLFGMGIFQEIDRKNSVDYINGISHFVKRAWQVTSVRQLPRVLPNALKTALTGRPGPVLVDLPMDIQVEKVHSEVPDLKNFMPLGRVYPDPAAIGKAAKILLHAKRPLILLGGGANLSGAGDAAEAVAEFLGAPVVGTFRGESKGGFPSDHRLWGFHPGNVGSSVSNSLSKEADVILAVGTTFSDETTSSYEQGTTFQIPPTKLVHIDIDPHEIGKNYPVAVGIVSDAKAGLEVLLTALRENGRRQAKATPWLKRFNELRSAWDLELKKLWTRAPMGMPNVVKMLREALPRGAIVSVSAGLPQEILSQQWTTYLPRTFLSSGGFSTMGFALPAAMGAKLAQPKRAAVAVEGDGSFLMNGAELSTAVENEIPIVVVVLNNYGWVSIRDLQIRGLKKRVFGTEFANPVDFEKLTKAYGAEYKRVEKPDELKSAVKQAISSESVSVVETIVERRFPNSGTFMYGYWDIPTP